MLYKICSTLYKILHQHFVKVITLWHRFEQVKLCLAKLTFNALVCKEVNNA